MRPRSSAFGALALLLGGAPLLAGMCAIQGVPAATLLVPYFLVSRNGSQGEDIPDGGADTLLSITNTGATGVIVQATVWNKYGKPVLAWNIPLAGHDISFFRMRDVLNGKLNVNPNAQRAPDPCGRRSGFGEASFTRFPNHDPEDAARSRSVYPVPAFSGGYRLAIWDSLDESGDVRSLLSAGASNILDEDNPYCGIPSDSRLDGDFSGSLTFDVMNTCTARYPDEARRYTSGALATTGWEDAGATPNALMGDVFMLDPGPSGGVSGDPMVALVFDPALTTSRGPTFYGRYSRDTPPVSGTGPPAFLFEGDGRMPLGTGFTFRFLGDSYRGQSTRLIVWRSGITPVSGGPPQTDLCHWWRDCVTDGPCNRWGSWAPDHAFGWLEVRDNDGNVFMAYEGPAPGGTLVPLYAFLQSQRLDVLDYGDLNWSGFKGGTVGLELLGDPLTNQAFLTVQHAGPGLAMHVGHAATVTRSPVSCGAARP